MTAQRQMSLEDYKAIARRRIWILIIPAIVCSVAAYIISLHLPARYKSETVVLVEAPEVPADIVRPIAWGDTNQRLATMREEILSRTRLQQIITKFDLYREDVARVPMEELVVRLRSSIEVSAVRPMDRTNASGLPGFTIDVVASQPELAQQICTEITSMFLSQQNVLLERRADNTADFIKKQLEDAKAKLDDQDAKLADFQRRYMGSLPDEAQTNFSLLTGLSSQLESVTQAINRAQQDKLFLESTLSQQVSASKLAQTGANPDTLARQIAALQEQLSALRTRYTDEYPDVVRIKKDIAQLQERAEKDAVTAQQTNEQDQDKTKEGTPVETPQVQQLRAQLHQIDVTIRERTAEQARLQEDVKRVQAKLELSPVLAQQYKALTRDYQTALNMYTDFLKKQSDSEVSRDLLRRQQGEQFRVLDVPSLPQEPIFPNHRLFAFAGFVGGLSFGSLIAFLLEVQDTTLRTEKDVAHLLKLPTLAVIPTANRGKRSREHRVSKRPLKTVDEPIDQGVGV